MSVEHNFAADDYVEAILSLPAQPQTVGSNDIRAFMGVTAI
jgi:hypothetical protein